MMVEGFVKECDMTGTNYERKVQGAWVVVQGETGRWCTVLHAGPEYIRDYCPEGSVLTLEQAEQEVAEQGGYLDIEEMA